VKVIFKKITVILLSLLLTSCIQSVVAGSFVVGNFLTKEKLFSSTQEDIKIKSNIKKELIKENIFFINPLVEEGRVLITGQTTNEYSFDINKAIDISWAQKGVKEVANEIQIVQTTRPKWLLSLSKDALITTLAKARILYLKSARYSNYKFKTINSIVYIYGLGKDEAEIRRVAEAIAKISLVKKVISYVVEINDERRK